MIETENESVRERVSDLEKKVLEQGDEIVCLRATLADVLRRINQLEGTRPVTTTPIKNGAISRGNCVQYSVFCFVQIKIEIGFNRKPLPRALGMISG